MSPRALRAMMARLSWGLVDQAVSSLTNFAVGIFVARELGLLAFGMFSLAWITYSVILNVSRGLGTDPLVVRFSRRADDAWRDAVARSSGTALAVGLAMGAVCMLAGMAYGGPLGGAFLALGAMLPGLMLQDSWRYAFFASGQGRKACVNDLVWGLALIPAMVLAAQQGTVVAFVLAWGLSGTVAAAYGLVQTRILPSLAGVRSWLHDQRDLGPRYLIENLSNSGGSQIRMYALGAIAGLSAVGAVRGAELLMGPFLAIMMGMSLVTVAEAARVLRKAPHRLRHFCVIIGAVQGGGALAWGIVLLLVMPDSVGELLLGDVWVEAQPLILPAAIGVACAGLMNGAASGLRALGASRRSLRSQLVYSAGYVIGGVTGAVLGGAVGSAWGTATAVLFGAAVWWAQLRIALREHAAAPAVPVTAENEEVRIA
jgi:O-antigen/teichoic acid export membrane protein